MLLRESYFVNNTFIVYLKTPPFPTPGIMFVITLVIPQKCSHSYQEEEYTLQLDHSQYAVSNAVALDVTYSSQVPGHPYSVE